MSSQNHEEHGAGEALGCLLFGLVAAIVGTVRVFNDLAALPSSGIQIGQYHSGLGVRKAVGVPDEERLKHTHVIGATGSGKTTLLKNLIIQDLEAGHGLAVIDPKGDLLDAILTCMPAARRDDVIIFDPTDTEYPVGFNMLEFVEAAYRSRTTSEVIAIFQKLFGTAWGHRLEHILRYTVLTLLEVPGSTLLDIPNLLLDADYRNGLLTNVDNFSARTFWAQEFSAYSDEQRTQAVLPILNRIGPWLAYPEVRNIIGQTHSSFHLRSIMDNRKILLVHIPQGILGEDTSHLLGAMLVSKLQLTAMARADLPLHQRPPFFLYVDEFQNFVTSSFEKILTEARSFGLGLIVANQYLEQLPKPLSLALDHNVAVRLSCSFEQNHYWVAYETPQVQDAKPRRVQPLPPPKSSALGQIEQLRHMCRQRYGRPRRYVEADILGRQKRRQRQTAYGEADSFWGE